MPRTSNKNSWNLGTFPNVQHPEARSNHVLRDAPLNDSNSIRKRIDSLWKFGIELSGSANVVRMQHRISQIDPQDRAVPGHRIAKASASAGSPNQSGKGNLALRDCTLIEANLVDCIAALPGQLFYRTQTP